MTQATFWTAVNTAFANGGGALTVGIANQGASNGTIVFVGNTKVTFDDNNLYLATTAGSANTQNGASAAAANGYTVLPNGLHLEWAQGTANTTALVWTFQKAFVTNAFSVVASGASTANAITITLANNTAASITCLTASVGGTVWNGLAIG